MKKTLILAALILSSACTIKSTPVLNSNFNEIDFTMVHRFEEVKSCKRFLLGIIPIPSGQPSMINVAKKGNLSKIHVIDYETGISIIPPGIKSCIIAYGER